MYIIPEFMLVKLAVCHFHAPPLLRPPAVPLRRVPLPPLLLLPLLLQHGALAGVVRSPFEPLLSLEPLD